MNMVEVMNEVGDAVETMAVEQTVYRYPPGKLSGPAAVVGYPTRRNPMTYNRGMARYELPLWLCVPNPTDPGARERIAAYMDDDGPYSIIACIEAATWTSCTEVTITEIEPQEMELGGVKYLAAVCMLDIIGPGRS